MFLNQHNPLVGKTNCTVTSALSHFNRAGLAQRNPDFHWISYVGTALSLEAHVSSGYLLHIAMEHGP